MGVFAKVVKSGNWEQRLTDQSARFRAHAPLSEDIAAAEASRRLEEIRRRAFEIGYQMRSSKLQPVPEVPEVSKIVMSLPKAAEEYAGYKGGWPTAADEEFANQVAGEPPSGLQHAAILTGLGGGMGAGVGAVHGGSEALLNTAPTRWKDVARGAGGGAWRGALVGGGIGLGLSGLVQLIKAVRNRGEPKQASWWDDRLLSKEAGVPGKIWPLTLGEAGIAATTGVSTGLGLIGLIRTAQDIKNRGGDEKADGLASPEPANLIKFRHMLNLTGSAGLLGAGLGGGHAGGLSVGRGFPSIKELAGDVVQGAGRGALVGGGVGLGLAGLLQLIAAVKNRRGAEEAKSAGVLSALFSPLKERIQNMTADASGAVGDAMRRGTRVTTDPGTLPGYYAAATTEAPKSFVAGYRQAGTDVSAQKSKEVEDRLAVAKRQFEAALSEEYRDAKAANAGQLVDGLARWHVKAAEGELNQAVNLYGALAALLGQGGFYAGRHWAEKADPQRQKYKAVQELIGRRLKENPIVVVERPEPEAQVA